MQQAAERAKSEDAALAAALKSKTVQAAFDKDAELKAQADTAARQSKDDVKAGADAIKVVRDRSPRQPSSDLSVLAKMLA